MRAGGLKDRVKKGACAVLAACAAALLGACAVSSTYAGIPLTAGAADPELQSLARRAQAGDKHAQLELGIRYEDGLGDLRRARRLYRLAAQSTPGRIWVYSPPVAGAPGVVIPIDLGKKKRGLPEAARRLRGLQEARQGW